MKRLLKVFAFLGGLGAVGWLVRNRFVAVTMNREPETPELVPEPVPAAPPDDDPARIDDDPTDAQCLRAADVTTAAQPAEADPTP